MSGGSSAHKGVRDPLEISQPSEVENRVSRLFRAPLDRVFRLFTDPETLPYVFSPDPASVKIEKLEFWKGGRFSIRVDRPQGPPVRFHGEYLEIVVPHRVVNTFEVDEFPGVRAIESDLFEPVGEFTRLTVSWKYERREDRDKMAGPEMEAAVTAMWDKAAELLAAGAPETTPVRT